MILIVEIAIGVFAGLLLYNGVVWYSKRYDFTLSRVLLSSLLVISIIGFLGLAGILTYHLIANPSYLIQHKSEIFGGALFLSVLGFGFALRSDIIAKRKAKNIATQTSCEDCGQVGLQFGGFKDGYKAPSGQEHARPRGKCLKCGHEQELDTI